MTLRATKRANGQPEIQYLSFPTVSHQDVCRLDVAMEDASRVRGIKRVRHLNREREKDLGVHGPTGNYMFQRCTFQKLHRNKRPAIFFPDLVDSTNVSGSGQKQLELHAGNGLRLGY
jgi:hypothetical protein